MSVAKHETNRGQFAVAVISLVTLSAELSGIHARMCLLGVLKTKFKLIPPKVPRWACFRRNINFCTKTALTLVAHARLQATLQL